MSIISDIERLINEHASAEVLGKHLAFFKDQVVFLEKKIASFESESKNFQAKMRELETDNEQLRKDVARLKEIADSAAKDKGAGELEDIEKKILKFLFDANKEFTAKQIAARFQLSDGLAQHNLDLLSRKGLLGGSLSMRGPSTYSINSNGREFVVKNKIA